MRNKILQLLNSNCFSKIPKLQQRSWKWLNVQFEELPKLLKLF